MANEERQLVFNVLHHDEEGRLLHADTVTGVHPSWGSGYTVTMPDLDVRDGDSITLTPKPVRPALQEIATTAEPHSGFGTAILDAASATATAAATASAAGQP